MANNKILIRKKTYQLFLFFNYLVLVFIVLYPFPFFKLGKYNFSPAYLVLVFNIVVLNIIFFYRVSISKIYWNSKITHLVWLLRFSILIIFLIKSYDLNISLNDIIVILGTIAITFYYELHLFFLSNLSYQMILKIWIYVMFFCLLIILFFIIPFLVTGLDTLINNVNYFRNYIIYWPNYVAIYICISLPILFYLIESNQNKKFLYILMLLLFIITLFFTFSRSGYMGTFFIFWGLYSKKKNMNFFQKNIFLSVLILCGIILFWVKEFSSLGNTLSHTTTYRLYRWKSAIDVYKQSPLIGYGFRSFTDILPEYSVEDKLMKMGSSHNDYIDILLRGGIIFFIVFYSILFYIIYIGLKLRHKLLYYQSFSIIALLLIGFVQNPLKDPVVLFFIWNYIASVSFFYKKHPVLFQEMKQNGLNWLKQGVE